MFYSQKVWSYFDIVPYNYIFIVSSVITTMTQFLMYTFIDVDLFYVGSRSEKFKLTVAGFKGSMGMSKLSFSNLDILYSAFVFFLYCNGQQSLELISNLWLSFWRKSDTSAKWHLGLKKSAKSYWHLGHCNGQPRPLTI